MASGKHVNWDGQIALVTGASSGIGREIVRQLAQAGATVFASARREERLVQLAAEFPDGCVVRIVADLAEAGTGARLVGQVLAQAGRLDLLVNNAGYGELVKTDEQTTKAVARQMQVNFMAVIEATLATIPAMKSQGGGRILNVASIVGHMGLPGVSAYVASKHALQGWSEASGYDLKQHNIAVTCHRRARRVAWRVEAQAAGHTGAAQPLFSLGARPAAVDLPPYHVSRGKAHRAA